MSVKALGDGRYMVRVYNPHGREYRKVVHGKRAADAHEADMKAKLASGRLLDPHGGKQTFESYAREQIEARDLRPSTRRRYERALAQHIYPALGHRPLRSLRYSDIAAFQTSMSRRFGDKHSRDIVVLVRSILRAAVLDGLLERNPAAGLRLDRSRPAERDLPTWDEVLAAADVALPDTRAAIIALALSGLRVSELCGLEPRHVHALRREVEVRQQLLREPGGSYVEEAKTDDSVRTVPVPQVVIDELAALMARKPGRFVFGGALGDSMANRVRAASTKAGRRFAPHDLRHLYTTQLLDDGVPLRVVDHVTGHRSTGMTLGVYAHVTPDGLARARASATAAWEAALARREQPGGARARS